MLLLERELELAVADGVLDAAAAGTGRVLVVAGEPGIGKTALVDATARRARERGFAVVAATGGALEGDFPFGVARQLFEPVATPELLAGAAGAAAPALGLGRVAAEASESGQRALSFELQHGLYWLVANLAERAPVLVAVDDAQWADRDSLGFLVYLARRLDELPVALLVAARGGEPNGAAGELLAALRALPGVAEAEPRPLSGAAVEAVVRAALGGGAEPVFCEACREVSGGNPFLLRGLLDDLGAAGVRPAADAVERVRGATPAAVQRNVLLRLAGLGGDAVALAQAVAILERDADLSVAAALAALDESAARTAADRLIDARVLAPAHPLRFAHPLLRGAVYADLGVVRRGAGHRRAAELLDERAPDRAAVHLLSTHPAGDPWVIAHLRAQAERALAHGSAGGARVLLERALSEPCSGEERAEVLLALGDAERRGGGGPVAERFEEALAIARGPRLRTRIVRELAHVHWTRGEADAMRALLEDAIRAHPADDPETLLELQADRAAFLQMNDPHAALAPLGRLTERVGPRVERLGGDTPVERRLLATLAFHRVVWAQTSGPEVARLAERALGGGRLLDDVGAAHPAVLAVLSVLQYVDRDADAEAVLEPAVAAARERGAAAELALMLTVRSRLSLFRGLPREAELDARDALAIGDAAGLEPGREFVLATLVAALVERADLDGAEAELAARGASSGEPRTHATRWLLLQSRARLRRAQGRFAEAMEDVGRADRERSSAYGVSLLGRAELALGLHTTGEHAEARRVAVDAVRRATAWEVPSTLGMTLRVQGLVEGGERGVAVLARAAEVLEGAPRRLEHARALVDLGAALRRANRRAQAREPLERGMEIAHRCAATATVERAHAELLACGARPRRPVRTGVEALTPSELRVARLAASGLTNREIAQALFVTRPTVTTHLGAVYRKLDVNAREQLAAVLDPGAKDHHPPSDAKAPGGREAVVP